MYGVYLAKYREIYMCIYTYIRICNYVRKLTDKTGRHTRLRNTHPTKNVSVKHKQFCGTKSSSGS